MLNHALAKVRYTTTKKVDFETSAEGDVIETKGGGFQRAKARTKAFFQTDDSQPQR